MKIRIVFSDVLHLTRQTVVQDSKAVEFAVPPEAEAEITAALDALPKDMPHEHLEVHIKLLGNDGREINSHKVQAG